MNKSTVNMAFSLSEGQKSLSVIPKNYVIMAKRISEGGELLLVRHPSEETVECESDKRKGRVCILGPLAELITIKGIKLNHACKDYHTAGKSRNDPVLMRSTVPDSLFLYQQYKLDIKGLQPIAVQRKEKPKIELKQKEKSKPIEELKISVEPQPPLVEETEVTEQFQPIAEPDAKGVEDLFSLEMEKSEIKRPSTQVKTSDLLRNLKPKDRFGSLPSAPLSSISEYSVLVKWKQHPSIPCYSVKSIFDILSRYGTIVGMGHLSVNSCLVLFEQFSVAVQVVRLSFIGPKAYPLICMWYYPYMYLDSLELLDVHPYKKHKLESEESKKLRQFRDMQEQVMACLKGRGTGLSYDRGNFKA